VGKTTTAIHLAAYLQTLAPTLLLDGDETRNATVWRDNGKASADDENDPGKLSFKIADLNSAAMLSAKYAHVVIDTGQRPTDTDLKTLAEGCNLLVIPTVPTGIDTVGLVQTVNALREKAPDASYRVLISCEEQGKEGKAGVPRQRAQIQAGVARHQLEIVREVVVIDVSGRHVEHDPQFQQVFRDLKTSSVDGVIVAEQSRLVRPENFGDFGILDHFRKNGKVIYTPSDRIDPTTRAGWYTLTVGGMISGDELQTLRERLDGGKEDHRKAGRHPGGPQMLPRGIRYVRERNAEGKVISVRWEHDGVYSERMRQAYALLIANVDSYTTIAQKVGGGWSAKGLRESMQNPIWAGVRSYRYEAKGEEYLPQGSTKPRRKLSLRVAPLEVPIALEPLIPKEDWQRAQEIMAQRKTRWRKTSRTPRFLAASLARCRCGKALYMRCGSRGHGTDHYYCASRHPRGKGCGAPSIYRQPLDEAIERLVTAHLLNAEFMLRVLDGVIEAQRAEDPTCAKREKALSLVDAKRKRLLDFAIDGTINKSELKQRLAVLDRERRELEATVQAKPPDISAHQVVEILAHAFAEFASLPFTAKRDLLRRAVREIVVDGHAIPKITLYGGFLGAMATTANSVLRSRWSCSRRCRERGSRARRS
jgi:DNA invertase Pin-like site-specific DNA recombinase